MVEGQDGQQSLQVQQEQRTRWVLGWEATDRMHQDGHKKQLRVVWAGRPGWQQTLTVTCPCHALRQHVGGSRTGCITCKL
jgi:hypothetical protein